MSREEQREREISKFPSKQGAQGGALSQDPKIVTGAETKSQKLSRLSHPGAPFLFHS